MDYLLEKYGVKNCCNCKHNKYIKDSKIYMLDEQGKRKVAKFFCSNKNSKYNGDPTLYDDTCDQWEVRNEL